MRRARIALLAPLLLGTYCPGYWHTITVPEPADASGASRRTEVVGVAERISLAHGLRSRPVASPRCTPHWGMTPSDTTGWSQARGWPDVCVDTMGAGATLVSLDAGLRDLPPGSPADSLWRALRDSLAPFGGTPQRKP